ncbi:hypothetical protein D3C75_1178650 [compost metagenome]
METWKFDDNIHEFDLVEATLTFSDGSKRWCLVTTPEKLVNHFLKDMDPPGFNLRHLIISKTMKHEDVERILKHLDSNDELLEASLFLG